MVAVRSRRPVVSRAVRRITVKMHSRRRGIGGLQSAGPQGSDDKVLGGSSDRARSVPFFYRQAVLPEMRAKVEAGSSYPQSRRWLSWLKKPRSTRWYSAGLWLLSARIRKIKLYQEDPH